VTTVQLWVCSDCIILLANGETADPVPDPAPLSLLTGEDVVPGGEHDDDCPNHAGSPTRGEQDCDCETQSFSWSTCDGCGSVLGGDRHAATVFSD
jgi:hypothetical protein